MKSSGQLANRHHFSVRDGEGLISMGGFSKCDPEDLVCFTADGGNHFLPFGIAKGSLLLAQKNATPRIGDLVIVSNQEKISVKLYNPDGNRKGRKIDCPTTTEQDRIVGILLGSFNFYR